MREEEGRRRAVLAGKEGVFQHLGVSGRCDCMAG